MTYRVKNWSKFQHYKNRNPPWIRFYVEVLDDYKADGAENDFHALPDDAKLTMVLIWALASRYGGVLPRVDSAWLAVKLGIKNVAVAPLIHGGFLIPFGDASTDASTDASAGARPSTSTSTSTSSETEGDARGITEPEPPSPPPPAPDATPAPAVPPTAPDSAAPITQTPPTKETPPKGKQRAVKAPESASDAINRLRPVYAAIGVDVDRELVKCRAWCQAHGHGEPTVRRLVNWLNRADKSIGGATPASSIHRGMHETIKVREL